MCAEQLHLHLRRGLATVFHNPCFYVFSCSFSALVNPKRGGGGPIGPRL